ncbi:MAG: rod shape-determining protein MreC [Gammaproteobacteria bacterium]
MVSSSADSEARSYRNASPGLAFFLTATLSLVLMFVDHRGDYLGQIRTWLSAAIYPLQVAINSPAAGLHWMQDNFALRSTLIDDNAALRKQALIQAAQLQRMAALQAENQRFRALLDSRARIPDRMTVAEILAVDMDPLRHRIVLNKGSPQGTYAGQVLLDATGVVGQIMRDQIYTSEAILITDPDHAIPVEVVRNGMRTIAVGTGALDQLSLPFLTRNADVKAGDLLVTSGLGGRFPAGYPVGTITAVDGSEGDAFLEVTAKPAANLDRLHEVLLVFSPEAEAQTQAEAEAGSDTESESGARPAAEATQ